MMMISNPYTMAATDKDVEEFRNNFATELLNLKFSAIFPDKTKVPLDEVCAYMVAYPNLRPMKTFGEEGYPPRLVLVVQADSVKPDGSEALHWRQAFYLSTGSSSSLPNTWLPFDGIMYGSPNKHAHTYFSSIYHAQQAPVAGETIQHSDYLWLNKYFFLNESWKDVIIPPGSPDAAYMHTNSFSPEFDFFYGDRIGTISYAMASYLLGGDYWNQRGVSFKNFILSRERGKYINLMRFEEIYAAKPHPVEPCFLQLQQDDDELPYYALHLVNQYISENNAVSYQNALLDLGVEIPSLSDILVNVQIRDVSYPIPSSFLAINMGIAIRNILINVRSGVIPEGEAQNAINQAYQTIGTVRSALHDQNKFEWDFRNYLDQIHFTLADAEARIYALGGKRKKGRKTYRMPRKYSKSYCRKTTCKKMGFTQKSSCRPYKNCFRSGRKGGSETVNT